MSRLTHGLAVWLCWGVLVLQGHGQALTEELAKKAGPKPPDVGILDKGGFFNRDSGAFKRISDQIRKLEHDHGYQIYLVVEPVLIATSPPELAAELRQSWLPAGNGLVIVFESDSRNLGFGLDIAASPDQQGNPARVPSYETSAILNRAMDAADAKLAPEAYLESLTGNLAGEFDGYFQRRATPPPAERSVKIGLLVAGTLALLGLGAIGLGGLARHPSVAGVRGSRFPAVDCPERLGAPCGGNVTARRFAPPRPRA